VALRRQVETACLVEEWNATASLTPHLRVGLDSLYMYIVHHIVQTANIHKQTHSVCYTCQVHEWSNATRNGHGLTGNGI